MLIKPGDKVVIAQPKAYTRWLYGERATVIVANANDVWTVETASEETQQRYYKYVVVLKRGISTIGAMPVEFLRLADDEQSIRLAMDLDN